MNIDEQIEEALLKIKTNLGDKLNFIVLFGSAADGELRPLSDIDIGVHVSASNDDLHHILGELLSLFDFIDETKTRIDVTLLNIASLSLLFRVIRDGKVLYTKNDEVWPCFVEYVLSRYPDWHYYIEDYLKQSLGV